MTRHYTYMRPSTKDARRDAEPPDLRDDSRPPGSIDLDWLGVKIQVTILPDPRHVRRFKVIDASGTVIFRGGVDAIKEWIFKEVPRNYLGRRHWL